MKVIMILVMGLGASMGALVPLAPPSHDESSFLSAHQGYPLTLQPESLRTATYDAGYPQYLVYNVPQVTPGVRTVATAVFANGRPAIAHIPMTYNYYGTPIYDFRYPFNPVLPGGGQRPEAKPVAPGHFPNPGLPKYPQKPPADDDGIEKLDEKVYPESVDLKSGGTIDNEGNDSVTIEAS